MASGGSGAAWVHSRQDRLQTAVTAQDRKYDIIFLSEKQVLGPSVCAACPKKWKTNCYPLSTGFWWDRESQHVQYRAQTRTREHDGDVQKTNGPLQPAQIMILANLLDSRVVFVRKFISSEHPLPPLSTCSLPLGVIGRWFHALDTACLPPRFGAP